MDTIEVVKVRQHAEDEEVLPQVEVVVLPLALREDWVANGRDAGSRAVRGRDAQLEPTRAGADARKCTYSSSTRRCEGQALSLTWIRTN